MVPALAGVPGYTASYKVHAPPSKGTKVTLSVGETLYMAAAGRARSGSVKSAGSFKSLQRMRQVELTVA